MDATDLYQAVGGSVGCHRLSEAFYARVDVDPVLRPLFPGKSLRCAIEAFAAFLAQFLGGPPEDAEKRWWLSLRESHARFRIGAPERQAWMSNMVKALDDVPIDEPVRHALRALFERASAYVIGEADSREDVGQDDIQEEMSQRWREQRALDDLVAALRVADADRALTLARGPTLAPRFTRHRAVFAHVLTLMIATRSKSLLEYVELEVRSDPSIAKIGNRHGRTLLHDASAQGNMRMVELLLRLGADPNVRTSDGHAPLYCVANECGIPGGGDVVRALVQAGAQVDARSDSKQCTALHMAARRGHTEVAEALVQCGADVNARDRVGVTPLQRARNCRKAAVASFLVSTARPVRRRGDRSTREPPHTRA